MLSAFLNKVEGNMKKRSIEKIIRRNTAICLLLGMLLTKMAMTNKINAPLATGTRTYKKPKWWISSLPITAISAVAPPGG